MAGLFVSFESAESKQDQCTNQELGPNSFARDMFRTMSHSWIDFTDKEYLKEEVGDAIMQCMPGWEGLSAR